MERNTTGFKLLVFVLVIAPLFVKGQTVFSSADEDKVREVLERMPTVTHADKELLVDMLFGSIHKDANDAQRIVLGEMTAGILAQWKPVPMSLYPTIATEKIFIVLPNGTHRATIVNEKGLVIFDGTITANNDKLQAIEMNNFQPGTYHLKIVGGQRNSTLRFVKQ